MDHPTPSLAQGKTPAPERRRKFFNTMESSFFDTGTAIETGEVSLPDEPPREADVGVRRWVRGRAGLVAGGACALLVIVGVWMGAGAGPATPPATIQRPAIAVPTIDDSPSPAPSSSQAKSRTGDTTRSVKSRSAREIVTAQTRTATGPRGSQEPRRTHR